MTTPYNLFYCDKTISGFIIRKLTRDKKYFIFEFENYDDFLFFLNGNVDNSLFEKKYYIFILNDFVIPDKDLFSRYNLEDHIIITNNFTNIANSTAINLLAKKLSVNTSYKLTIFMLGNVANILHLDRLQNFPANDTYQFCTILEYMDITDSELAFEIYISAAKGKNSTTINDVVEVIEESNLTNLNILSTTHPGAISLYIQRKLITKLKERKSTALDYKRLISLHENDKDVKLHPNEANYIIKLRFLTDKMS